MKNGIYRGDIGMVMTDSDPRGQVVLRLIPRLDLIQSEQPKHLYMKDYLRKELETYLNEVRQADEDAAARVERALESLEMHSRPTLSWCKGIYYKDDHQQDVEVSLEQIWLTGEKEYIAQRAT